MNAITTLAPQPVAPIGLVPATMSEAMQLAEMMAKSKLVPADLQKSPADCLMVIQQAIRWQMDPFAVAQECSVIKGKLMQSGKLVAAVVNARGNLVERLSYSFAGTGEARTITVRGRLRGEAEARTVEVRLKDARTNNTVWQTQPDQQLMYHGARVWARRHTPELMLGVWSPEEFDEPAPRDVTPPTPAPFPVQTPAPKVIEQHDPETGELPDIPPALDRRPKAASDTGPVNWIEFGKAYIDMVTAAASLDDADAIDADHAQRLDEMKHEAPKVYARMMIAVAKARAAKLPPASPFDAG